MHASFAYSTADSPLAAQHSPQGRVLIIAGSDSGGGAGIQGDLKTVQALGGYGMTAITALTAQNTLGVSGIFPVDPAFVAQQMRMCLTDIGVDALKTGMLYSAEVIEAIAGALEEAFTDAAHPLPPLVLDPVMLAKGGSPLLAAEALEALKQRLIPRAAVLTPNLPEAELLLGHAIAEDEMIEAAQALLALGAQSVLLKGGHGSGEFLTDVLVAEGIPPVTFTVKRQHTTHTHGTGCSFASAIATGLAQKLPLVDAVARAHGYVQGAIARAPGFGAGHGPLGH